MRHPLRLALGVVLLGAALRFAALAGLPPQRLVGDERYYVEVAENLATGRGHVFERDGVAHRAFRPPGHPWLLSLALPRTDPGRGSASATAPPRLLRVQALLGSLLVAVVIALGRALFGWREALLAGLLAALDPTLVAHSHYLWSEPLAAVLLGAALTAAAAAREAPGATPAALTGVLFGLAALTREVALPIAAACALWLALGPPPRGAALRRAVLLLGLAAAVVAPWTLRNARLLERFVPVATVGAFAAREGNTFSRQDWRRSDLAELKAFRAEYFGIPDEAARLDFARRQTLERVRAEPLWLPKKLVRTFAELWNPDSFLFLKLGRGAYGPLPPWAVRAILALAAAGYALVVVAAIAGAAGTPERGRRSFAALVFAAFYAVHVVANASPRFRLPLVPLLLVYASHVVLRPREVAARLRGGPGLAAVALLLLFVALSLPRFLGDAASLWSGGARPGSARR